MIEENLRTYSKTRTCFQNDVKYYFEKFDSEAAFINEQDTIDLPEPVQRHLKLSGYTGKTKMTLMKAYIPDAPLKDSDNKPPMIVDYTLCSFAKEPVRLAYIKTSILKIIPFEAYDSTQNGIGFMKGVIGKIFTLFNQTGPEMDKAQLLTWLGECFFIPASVTSKYISWEAIDERHAKATITYRNISGSGTFTFHENGLVKSFQTDERARIENDGSITYPEWSMVYEDFAKTDGIIHPSHVKTIWHDSDGDLVYFDADNIIATYH